MNNDQCAAIIKAIETATEFLFYKGVSIREKVGDSTSDDASKTADIAAFSATMDDLINNLPDENP